jgi:ANTAR domain
MLVYDVDEEVAFDLLRWLSQERNVKLGLLAQQIRADLRAVQRAGLSTDPPSITCS